MDGCNKCTGGTTGLTPNADKDCAGECNGQAIRDQCGTCVGGSTRGGGTSLTPPLKTEIAALAGAGDPYQDFSRSLPPCHVLPHTL
jgi:hypothetical protein